MATTAHRMALRRRDPSAKPSSTLEDVVAGRQQAAGQRAAEGDPAADQGAGAQAAQEAGGHVEAVVDDAATYQGRRVAADGHHQVEPGGAEHRRRPRADRQAGRGHWLGVDEVVHRHHVHRAGLGDAEGGVAADDAHPADDLAGVEADAQERQRLAAGGRRDEPFVEQHAVGGEELQLRRGGAVHVGEDRPERGDAGQRREVARHVELHVHLVAVQRGEQPRAAEGGELRGVGAVQLAELGQRQAADREPAAGGDEPGAAGAEAGHRNRVEGERGGRAAAVPVDLAAPERLGAGRVAVVGAAQVGPELVYHRLDRGRIGPRPLAHDRSGHRRGRAEYSCHHRAHCQGFHHVDLHVGQGLQSAGAGAVPPRPPRRAPGERPRHWK